MIMSYTRLVGFLCDTSGDSPGNDEKSISDVLVFAYDLERNALEKSEHYEVGTDPCPSSNNKERLTSAVRNVEDLLSEGGEQGKGSSSCLCTFGTQHLRMVLHPMSFKHNIDLSDNFYAYFDLKNIFKQFYGSVPTDQATHDSLKYILEKGDFLKECGAKILIETTVLLRKMIEEGFVFKNPEHIMKTYHPSIWEGEINDENVVKARGLPWSSTESDVANFFIGLNIEKGGVAFCMTAQGRKNGEAVISFESKEHRCLALKRHKHYLGSRYIEVFRSTGKEFIQCLASSSKEAKAFLMQKYDYIDPVIIRMRGLPYTCNQSEIVEFFKALPNVCEVLDGEEGVLLIHQSEGKNTGDAFVLFANEDEAAKALMKHKQRIGSRYIELFKSATSEIQQILVKNVDPRSCNHSIFSQPNFPNSSCVKFQSTSNLLHLNESKGKDCTRLSGLPPETSVNDLVFFLSDHVKDIRHKGIHLVYDIRGLQTGEAFIEMVGEKQAEHLQYNRDKKLILVNGNRHQVQVEKCSIDEMAKLLHGIRDYPFMHVPLVPPSEASIEQQCCSHRTIHQDSLISDSHPDFSSVYFTSQPSFQFFTIMPMNGVTASSLMLSYPKMFSLNKDIEAKIR